MEKEDGVYLEYYSKFKIEDGSYIKYYSKFEIEDISERDYWFDKAFYSFREMTVLSIKKPGKYKVSYIVERIYETE